MKLNPKIILSAFIFVFYTIAYADIPEKASGYINDYVGKINAQEKQFLEQKLSDFEAQTSNQIFVLLYSSLGGKAIEEFTHETARKWKIGQKDKNNGILLAIFVNDRKVRIEVGYGLEGAVPDITAKQIIENEIKPALKANNYYKAIDAGVTAIIQATKGEYTGTGKSAYRYKTGKNNSKNPFTGLFFMLFAVVFIVIIVVAVIKAISRSQSNNSSYNSGYNGGYYYGGYYDNSSYYNNSDYSSSDYSSSSSWDNSSSSWDSGSSFDGGGGGDFGGGGSSGDW
jgi:uncharacterized protein